MKSNKFIISIVAASVALAAGAQTSFDAAKLYEEELNGTARYVGMGGAMGALGSDPSVISHNPAGIGTYRNSDINMSLGFFGTSVNTDPMVTVYNKGFANGRTYYSNNNKSELNMAFDNFSAIFSGYESGDSYLNFGFSYRKLQNMDRDLDYVDKFYIPDTDNEDQLYAIYREYQDHQRNRINSFDFNLSCNLSDKVYLGWTIGLLSANASSEGCFYDYYPSYSAAELEDVDKLVPEYEVGGCDYTAVDKMNKSDGPGWNMAFGVIVRPIPALRFGASFKTPTYYRQTLEYSDYLYAFEGTDFKDENGNVEAFNNAVDYKFSSPWSIDLSAGLTFGHTAIGAEFEKHFTQRSVLSIGNNKMAGQGAVDFQDYSSLKLGIEQNISNLSLRAGYNYIEPMFKDNAFPFLDDSEFNAGKPGEVGRSDFQIDRLGKTRYFTAGLGYCSAPDRDGTQFYVDMAYVHGLRNSTVNVNEYVEDVDVNYNYKTDKVLLTIGWNF